MWVSEQSCKSQNIKKISCTDLRLECFEITLQKCFLKKSKSKLWQLTFKIRWKQFFAKITENIVLNWSDSLNSFFAGTYQSAPLMKIRNSHKSIAHHKSRFGYSFLRHQTARLRPGNVSVVRRIQRRKTKAIQRALNSSKFSIQQ